MNNAQKGSLWWWMYVPFIFAMTFTIHIHYYSGNYFKAVVIVSVLLSILLFVIDTQSNNGSPKWFMWPAGILAMILIAYYYYKYIQGDYFSLALYEYGIANILFFLAWIGNFQRDVLSFPWWIIPFFLLSIPVVIAHLKYHRDEHRYWVFGCVSLAILSIMTFFIWGFVESYWPWFLIEWVIALAIIFVLWYYKRNKSSDVIEISDSYYDGGFTTYSSTQPGVSAVSHDISQQGISSNPIYNNNLPHYTHQNMGQSLPQQYTQYSGTSYQY